MRPSSIGGKVRDMHAGKRTTRITGTGGKDKTPVMGILERGKDGTSCVRTTVIPNRKKKAIQAEVCKHVVGSALYTDLLLSYDGLASGFAHQVVDHGVQYVDGKIHTNGSENFWSLLKRGINGTYVSVEPLHLLRYLDEQAFRYNDRKMTDGERFSLALGRIVGNRFRYKELIGNEHLHEARDGAEGTPAPTSREAEKYPHILRGPCSPQARAA